MPEQKVVFRASQKKDNKEEVDPPEWILAVVKSALPGGKYVESPWAGSECVTDVGLENRYIVADADESDGYGAFFCLS